jgi:hypothetical protein
VRPINLSQSDRASGELVDSAMRVSVGQKLSFGATEEQVMQYLKYYARLVDVFEVRGAHALSAI